MSTKICQVVFDAHDPKALATFWKDLLGWEITIDRPDEVEIGSDREGDVPLGFVPNDEPKRAKNRLHLDLGSTSSEHQRELVQCALDLGGSHCDIGQGERRWTVMADPEGNEFCVAGRPDS